MASKVVVESNSNGTFIKIDGKYYDLIERIPDSVLSSLTNEQLTTVKDFFSVDDDPRGDKKKIFGGDGWL